MILVVVMVLFLLTRFPTCKVHRQVTINARQQWIRCAIWLESALSSRYCGAVPLCGYAGRVWSFTIRLALELGDINERDAQTSWSIALPASLLASL